MCYSNVLKITLKIQMKSISRHFKVCIQISCKCVESEILTIVIFMYTVFTLDLFLDSSWFANKHTEITMFMMKSYKSVSCFVLIGNMDFNLLLCVANQ